MERACEVLRRGGLVAFPTETVYGLGADARNPRALRRIFEVKGRPADHPLIVHLGSVAELPQWVLTLPPKAIKLACRFWPGPLTLILRAADSVPREVTGGQDTVGLRVPSHPLAQRLLEQFGGGIAGPSANRFGRLSPTQPEHVRAELGDAVDLILDGGFCGVGIESTIVDVSGGTPRLLRPGAITREQLEDELGCVVGARTGSSPRVSGSLAAHYAPRSPLRLVDREWVDRLVQSDPVHADSVVLARRPAPASNLGTWVEAPADAEAYAQMLYGTLRRLDLGEGRTIIVESPPQEMQWEAVMDRLSRAAVGSGAATHR